MSVVQYTLSDYNAIITGTYKNPFFEETIVNVPMNYKLPDEVLDVIQKLSQKMGSVTPQSNTFSSTSTNNYRHRGGRSFNPKPASIDSWVKTPEFKPTIITEKKEGPEKIMNDIRGTLNKISNVNYDMNSELIVKYLQEMKSQPDTHEEDMTKIAKNIFDIASTNKFFSETYANLYKKLMTHFPEFFTEILDKLIKGFTNTMKNIVYVDQNTNYDEFCKYNKENDKRKATTVFITNLVKMDVLPLSTAICIIQEIFDILNNYIHEPNKIIEVEEITENIFLLCTNNDIILKQTPVEIKSIVSKLASMKSKEVPSISSRAIFKYMDLLDKMNKSDT